MKRKSNLTMAQKAHYNAKIYVLTEKLNNANTHQEFMETLRQLDCVEHHLECLTNRTLLLQERTATNKGLRKRMHIVENEVVFRVAKR